MAPVSKPCKLCVRIRSPTLQRFSNPAWPSPSVLRANLSNRLVKVKPLRCNVATLRLTLSRLLARVIRKSTLWPRSSRNRKPCVILPICVPERISSLRPPVCAMPCSWPPNCFSKAEGFYTLPHPSSPPVIAKALERCSMSPRWWSKILEISRWSSPRRRKKIRKRRKNPKPPKKDKKARRNQKNPRKNLRKNSRRKWNPNLSLKWISKKISLRNPLSWPCLDNSRWKTILALCRTCILSALPLEPRTQTLLNTWPNSGYHFY